ncbi:MAG: serine/threonine protein kinase [Deltaproteobacteria bacterium]|nr:serine/threonine protein kinase [Deltaproteobacteria bacterium]
MPRDEEATELLGKVLSGRYRLDSVIGEGGMGAVYSATHLKLERPVAVKVLRASMKGESTHLDRFFQEARAAASVQSTGVVDVMDLDVDPQIGPYLVMEKLEGEPLTEVLRRGKTTPEEAVALIGELLDVLAAVHKHDIIHRDLKPPNVYLHRDEKGERVLKVLDFGIAKVRQRHLTLTGEIVGTPRFMAPEQAQGDPLDQRTDLYSAGLLLYCCLCGKPPFDGVVGGRVITLLEKGPTPLRELEPDLPEALHRVVEKALSPKPADRFDTAAEMATALRAALQEPGEAPAGSASRGTSSPPKDKAAIPMLAVIVVLLAIVLGVGLYVFRDSLP